MKKALSIAILLVTSTLLSGCYWNARVESNEVGLIMRDGVSISQVVTFGRYTNMGWFSQLVVMDASAKTLKWSDPDLWTNYEQPLGFEVGVTYRRKGDDESARTLWQTYNAEARDDAALETQVANRVPRVAKAITTKYTLDQMLGIGDGNVSVGRAQVQKELFDLLAPELSEFGIELLDVGINNITPDPAYAQKLKDKAQVKIDVEIATQRTAQLAEQVKQEEAQTKVALEIARRNNAVAEEQAKVYTISPEAYELRRLELLSGVIGERDKLYFIPQGSDITLFLGSNTDSSANTYVPIPGAQQ